MKETKKIASYWIPIFFGILTAIFFYQTILSGKIPVPVDTLVGLYHPWRDVYAQTNPRGVPFKNFLITDPVRQQIPWRKVAMEQWKRGQIPTWNAYSFAGSRLDSNIQAAVYYPLNLIFLLPNFVAGWSFLIIIQPFVAGLGLFLYLRHHKLSTIASIFGSISWAFGGFSIAWLTWGTIVQSAMWLPILLLCLDHLIEPRMSKSEETRWMCVSWMSVFLMMSAGHSQVALYGLTVALLYALRLYRQGKYSRQINKMVLSRLVIVGLVSIVFTLPIWLPQLSTLTQSTRIAQESHPQGWFLPWQNLIQFVAPDFFGNPATMNYWGVWNYGEFIGYIGIIPIIFAISAAFTTTATMFWSFVAIGALFFMLPHPITVVLSTMKIPLLGVLQPTRLMMPVVLALSVLVAYGIDSWRSLSKRIMATVTMMGAVFLLLLLGVLVGSKFLSLSAGSLAISLRNLVVPIGVFTLSVALIVAGRHVSKQKQTYILVVLLLLTVIDIFRFGWKFTPFVDAAYFFPSSKVIEYLQRQPRPFRVASIDDRVLPPNVSDFYNIESVGGYDPLASLRYENFLTASERNKPDLTRPTGFNRIYTAHNISSILFPLFSVQYILSIDAQDKPWLTLAFEEGQTKVYKNLLAFPRVYLAEQIDVVEGSDPQKILAKIFEGMRQSRPAVVEVAVPVLSIPLTSDESVTISSYKPEQIIIKTHTVNPRFVVVLNNYDGLWHATLDGKPISLVRVNYLFIGLVVPAGSHEVQLIH